MDDFARADFARAELVAADLAGAFFTGAFLAPVFLAGVFLVACLPPSAVVAQICGSRVAVRKNGLSVGDLTVPT